ncbi:antibiotic biosynthesis monooxygenase family protein [Dyella caseinilytica]|uniref:Antibiotic biosynthesis monooxygenase n=1 Tax=Dyella caseinilytica TaxID=1849581 RepID=A0ABX7GNX0_9GAMM|nr:antibiotic biosynthesis monooxygenase [Dyella caseinilytica]QRN52117.1 antibiotic biosynthesis monooxygenase [Dyella caseinilytica]
MSVLFALIFLALTSASTIAMSMPDSPSPASVFNAKRSLFAVVFEVKPDEARGADYLRIAKGLRPELTQMPGFLENERFRSRSRPGYLLSLSLWDDEKALVRWRTVEKHHQAQVEGRQGVLDDYHIRVGEVTRVAGRYTDQPVGWMRQDQTQVGQAAALTIIDGVVPPSSSLWKFAGSIAPGHGDVVSEDIFDHLTTPGRMAMLVGWRTQQEANAFAEDAIRHNDVHAQIYAIRVIRDYGLKDRREAPQFYPAQ